LVGWFVTLSAEENIQILAVGSAKISHHARRAAAASAWQVQQQQQRRGQWAKNILGT